MSAVSTFRNEIALKFQLYNSLFTSLPFDKIERTGVLLSVLQNLCEEGFEKNRSPKEIIAYFFAHQTQIQDEGDKINLLFRFVQYVERQVVLYDALEDAAFAKVNDMHGNGTLKHLQLELMQTGKTKQFLHKLKDFSVRLVLTAHPTQFYPGSVLGIINDLAKSVTVNNVAQIDMYLQQLGKTPFFNKKKPTPYDEAVSLIWYLENVFYKAAGRIVDELKQSYQDFPMTSDPILQMGFWPGGDRDGNPYVTAAITMKVAAALRSSIIKCYYLDIRKLKRRLTFKGIDAILNALEERLYKLLFITNTENDLKREELLLPLQAIKELLAQQHDNLFVNLVDSLINKVQLFGLYFASLDIRQESSVHGVVMNKIATERKGYLPEGYPQLSDADKLSALLLTKGTIDFADWEPGIELETMQAIRSIQKIQAVNGEAGCSRYVISQCGSALEMMEVYALLQFAGFEEDTMAVDIVPLFETIDDLHGAAAIMEQLYKLEDYRAHLARRGNKQTIMVGFSDGTKDGGYMMANWAIYKAKATLSRVSAEAGVGVLFFDGRGGPPARGGGKTHKFYASLGKNIAGKAIQITVQGQTVSSSFGTADAAQFNLEQLLHAGVSNELFSSLEKTLNTQQETLLETLAEESYLAYKSLRDHPQFLDYLSAISPLQFYSDTNIGSRPAKRNKTGKLTLKDLRAIPFVGAWSQIKQNVTGYYGMGAAFQAMDKAGRLEEVKALYKQSVFFKTLIDNCEMAMLKCYFPLTEYLAKDTVYKGIWKMIQEEYALTEKYLYKITENATLMNDYPVDRMSILLREKIVLPLLTIQQYALQELNQLENTGDGDGTMKALLEKLITRASFGIINAGRNSA